MTNEAMKMARRICARIVEGDSDNPLRVMRANCYLSGDLDDDHHMAVALAAIIETQELCAALAEDIRKQFGSPTGDAYTCGLWDQGVRIAAAIRSGQQFRKDV